MIAQQVAKRYSTALFDLTREHNLLDQAWQQFKSLRNYLDKDRIFLDFMSAPQVPDEDKQNLIKNVFGDSLEKPLYHFLLFLAAKRRIKYLAEILDEFDLLVKADKGIAKATCITVSKINDAERQNLITQLKKKTSLEIELEEKLDKSILGGMIVILHNQIIDGSMRRGLDELKNRLMKVKVH